MSGGQIAFFACALIGAVIGFYIRDKNKEDSILHSMIACTAGSLLVAWLMARFVYGALIIWPIYAVAGAVLANFVLRASQQSEK